MKIAICPGSFDPVTVGHVDIISRASKLFDKVVVAVLINKEKDACFSTEERVHLLRKSLSDIKNVEVAQFNGLLVDYAKKIGASVIVRGLRAITDFEYELQTALTNKRLYDGIETLFLTTKPENMYISSSLVRQIASFGGDITAFVPEIIIEDIMKKFV